MQKQKSSNRAYFNLVRSIGVSDFKVKYNSSILGYFWTLAKPLMLFSILYVVFTKFIKIGANIPYYSIQLLLGIIVWNYFSESSITAMNSIVSKGGLIRKIYFPREIIVTASGLTSFMTLLLNLAVIPVFLIIKEVPVTTQAVLIVLLLAELFIFTVGLSLLLAAMFVKFRDIGHIWEVALQGLFYATPVIYDPSVIPASIRPYVMLNPIAQIIQDMRHVVITPTAVTSESVLPGIFKLMPYAIAIIVTLVGVFYFRSASKSFAEEV